MFGSRGTKWYKVPSHDPTPADEAFPPALPSPKGWFCIGFSDEVPPGKVVTSRLVDQDVVLYRTRAGLLRAVEPYCPHLGAHLGVGGKVEGEDLVCPFHGFGFGPDGACVRSGYGKQPPKARVRHLEIRETNGIIFAWRNGEADNGPEWEIESADLKGYSRLIHITVELPSHPQEITENAVDLGHFPVMHNSQVREFTLPLDPGSPVAAIHLKTLMPIPYLPWWHMTTSYDGELRGLGCATGTVTVQGLGLMMHAWLMPTVVGPWRIQLRFAACIRISPPRWLPSRLGRHVARTVSGALCSFGLRSTITGLTLGADSPIWHTKQHQPAPRIADGDGPIMAYRRWAKQFYSARPHRDGEAGSAGLISE
ncbi:Rieske 2Fe-2S domain-containing protein [Streptomyces europaeiscabiei]|uniref:Rieske 2Fe-2S domain-containing protein n=1 Tax=Streptomyces europaeiscabiei TaxID=146819 RepID=UPI0038D4DA5D